LRCLSNHFVDDPLSKKPNAHLSTQVFSLCRPLSSACRFLHLSSALCSSGGALSLPSIQASIVTVSKFVFIFDFFASWASRPSETEMKAPPSFPSKCRGQSERAKHQKENTK